MQVVLEASFRIGIAAAIVAAVLALARIRSGAVRHAVWTAVLVAMPLMPLLQYSAQSLPVGEMRVAAELPALPIAAGVEESPTSARLSLPAASPIAEAPQSRPERGPAWPAIVLAVYLTGVAVLLLRVLFGWRRICKVAVASKPVPELSGGVPVHESPQIAAPVTMGAIKPAVVLPTGWRDWSSEKLRAVLAHEMAHARRRDNLTALTAHLNRCVFWFHPLSWWLERTLANCAEHACDECGVRAVGEGRRYAAMLVEIAETVRRSGGRISWQGIGVDGTGAIGKRIDRILGGDGLRRVSRLRKTAAGLGCAAAIFAAASCRQQPKTTATAIDVEDYEQYRARTAAERARLEEAKSMVPAQVSELEDAIEKKPNDLSLRRNLLILLSSSAENTIGREKTIAARRKQVEWLVRNRPESGLAASRIFPTAAGPLPDPATYASLKRLWLTQSERPDANVAVLKNAALFFQTADKPLAEKMLLRAQALDAKCCSRQLGNLYYEALVGSNASMPMGVVRSVSMSDAHGAYAQEVRKKLAESTDAVLLAETGHSLFFWATALYRSGRIDFDPAPLGRAYVERAVKLASQSLSVGQAMAMIRMSERYARLKALGPQPLQSQYEAISALPAPDRMAFLARLAEAAYIGGEGAGYYRHDDATATTSREQAKKFAEEALRLATGLRNDPDYGTAVYRANMVLGMVTMRAGDKKSAAAYLIEASKAPRTEELAFLGQAFSLKLPAALLKYGERDAVIEYLDRFAQVSAIMRSQLLNSAALIRSGRMPIWYRYLAAAR